MKNGTSTAHEQLPLPPRVDQGLTIRSELAAFFAAVGVSSVLTPKTGAPQVKRRLGCHTLVTARGETKTLGMWAAERGMSVRGILGRIEKGWDEERAIFEPARPGIRPR